ncbi:ketopantoate reductase PanE/ApbA C terminal-domain-containing protein [Lactarius hengduanensis]|nr:ketopantoate reductase PanE/ApbA C terminal-domain-containing protein [Lactarius hengduanensis]
MRFHVLGLGPIGSLVSHHLCKTLDATTHDIVLIHKNAQQLGKANLARNVLKVEREGVVETSTAFRSEIFEAATQHRYERRQAKLHAKLHARATRNSENKRAAGLKSTENEIDTAQHTLLPIESLIVALKAYTVVDAVKALVPRLTPDSTIVLLHNGMGVYERLIDNVFRNPDQRPHFIVASNDHGAWNKDYFHTVHAGIGSITFGIVTDPRGRDFEASIAEGEGPEPERSLSLDDIMSPQGDDSTYRPLRNTVAVLSNLTRLNATWRPISHVETAMKRKLVVNTVVNPLTALLGCRNGDLLESEETMKIMKRVCFEAAEAFARQAQAHQEGGSWNDRVSRARIRSGFSRVSPALSAHALEEECLRVIRVNAGNTSSMLSDVRSGSYTEIDYMAGYLLGLGRSFNLPMSTTTTLLNLIKLRTTIPLDRLTYK